MNAAIKNIPWFIEGSDCAMLRVSPDAYVPANRSTVYVRLDDVLAVLRGPVEKIIVQDGVEYVSVGMGGEYLVAMAKRHGWELYAHGPASDPTSLASGRWSGNEESWEYYIKKI